MHVHEGRDHIHTHKREGRGKRTSPHRSRRGSERSPHDRVDDNCDSKSVRKCVKEMLSVSPFDPSVLTFFGTLDFICTFMNSYSEAPKGCRDRIQQLQALKAFYCIHFHINRNESEAGWWCVFLRDVWLSFIPSSILLGLRASIIALTHHPDQLRHVSCRHVTSCHLQILVFSDKEFLFLKQALTIRNSVFNMI